MAEITRYSSAGNEAVEQQLKNLGHHLDDAIVERQHLPKLTIPDVMSYRNQRLQIAQDVFAQLSKTLLEVAENPLIVEDIYLGGNEQKVRIWRPRDPLSLTIHHEDHTEINRKNAEKFSPRQQRIARPTLDHVSITPARHRPDRIQVFPGVAYRIQTAAPTGFRDAARLRNHYPTVEQLLNCGNATYETNLALPLHPNARPIPLREDDAQALAISQAQLIGLFNALDVLRRETQGQKLDNLQ